VPELIPGRFDRYTGNPLAIVSVRNNALSQERKQKIAKEFNYSETVFLHDAEPGKPRQLDIFTPHQELNFAGHPVIGTAHYIFQKLENDEPIPARQGPKSTSLITKAGPISVQFDPQRQVAAAEIPHKVHTHKSETTKDEILALQSTLTQAADVEKMSASFPVVSIVKGMTFTLVDFTAAPSLLTELKAGEAPKPELDEGWTPSHFGTIYYSQLVPDTGAENFIHRIRVRMICDGIEDPATGSGCSALAAFLALRKGGKDSRHAFAIEQGVEMGRRSQICIEVRLDGSGTEIASVTLSGRATFITEGRLF
jgi:trans-2,3-dihydro-3-hydroxyanthranilate isomerase